MKTETNMFISSIPTIHIELLGDVNMYLALGIEILTSILLGGLIGLDRERKHKAAGIKTHILICLGATLYTAVALMNAKAAGGGVDPNRISAQVASGIGFLGAGAIIQGRGGIFGLTTAAGIWVVAAVGVAIGSGYPLSALIFTVTVMFILGVLDPLYHWMEPESDFLIEVVGDFEIENIVHGLLDEQDINPNHVEVSKDEEGRDCSIVIHLKISSRNLRKLITRFRQQGAIRLINFRLLKKQEIL